MGKMFQRFLVLQVLLLWQGGFLFYAAVVVPVGTRVHGPAGQGAVTARVTDVLNVIGGVALAVLVLELSRTRDPNRRRTFRRWWAWIALLLCHGLLIYLHVRLDAILAEYNYLEFYPLHRMYLWTSTVQWLACVLLSWWTLWAWRAEDGERPA